jgi:hypothetical protein
VYKNAATQLATALKIPVQNVVADPHCISPACATSAIGTGTTNPCPDQVLQKCIQKINYTNAGNIYTFGGVKQVATCVLSHSENGEIDQDITGVKPSTPTPITTQKTAEDTTITVGSFKIERNKALLIGAGLLLLFLLDGE